MLLRAFAFDLVIGLDGSLREILRRLCLLAGFALATSTEADDTWALLLMRVLEFEFPVDLGCVALLRFAFATPIGADDFRALKRVIFSVLRVFVFELFIDFDGGLRVAPSRFCLLAGFALATSIATGDTRALERATFFLTRVLAFELPVNLRCFALQRFALATPIEADDTRVLDSPTFSLLRAFATAIEFSLFVRTWCTCVTSVRNMFRTVVKRSLQCGQILEKDIHG